MPVAGEIDIAAEQIRAIYDSFTKNQLELQKQVALSSETFKAVYENTIEPLQKFTAALAEYVQEFSRVMTAGLQNFEEPTRYSSSKFQVDPRFKEIVLREVGLIGPGFKESQVGYLTERLENGLQAHLEKRYQHAIYCELSVIDGVLRQFFLAHNDFTVGRRRPGSDELFAHFQQHYRRREIGIRSKEFDRILRRFFQHRNEIVHGGKYAFFDENLSLIALGIVALVFETVRKFLVQAPSTESSSS